MSQGSSGSHTCITRGVLKQKYKNTHWYWY